VQQTFVLTDSTTQNLPAIPRPLRQRPHRASVERRRPVRLVGLDQPGVFDHRIPLRIVDLSEHGLGVESCRPLPFLTRAEIRVDPCGPALAVRVTWSRLVRVRTPPGPTYRSGVQLLEPTFEQIRALLEAAARAVPAWRKQPPPLPV
jgi:hypothetical protein